MLPYQYPTECSSYRAVEELLCVDVVAEAAGDDVTFVATEGRGFPNVTGKDIYKVFLNKVTPEIETKYPLYNWKKIWQNIHCK